jgi:beta-lactamase class D
MEECRREGFALDLGEMKPGLNSLAVPVFGPWLDGTLLTDAMHQAAFTADLFSDDPIFDRYAAFDVKELMQVEEGDGWTLTWSTGTDTTAEDPVAWLIGSVMTVDQDWAIAMHIRIPPGSPVDLEKRKRLTLAVLEGEGIIPSSGQ